MSGVQDKSSTLINRRRGPRTTRRQQSSAVLVASASITLVMLLSGCTFGEHYAILDREAEPADAPPSAVADQELHGVDIDSLRFATEYEGDRLYLAKRIDPKGGICLLTDSPGDDGVSEACGGSWIGTRGPSGHEYHVHPDGTPLPDDVYTDLTENISVKTG